MRLLSDILLTSDVFPIPAMLHTSQVLNNDICFEKIIELLANEYDTLERNTNGGS
jgi:hypothetical protein